jgi:hypothetical protein
MKDNEEKGFLSQKFDDWSDEPIPNGWNKIEEVISKDRKHDRLFFTMFVPIVIFTLGVLSHYVGQNLEGNTLENATSGILSKDLRTTQDPSPSISGKGKISEAQLNESEKAKPISEISEKKQREITDEESINTPSTTLSESIEESTSSSGSTVLKYKKNNIDQSTNSLKVLTVSSVNKNNLIEKGSQKTNDHSVDESSPTLDKTNEINYMAILTPESHDNITGGEGENNSLELKSENGIDFNIDFINLKEGKLALPILPDYFPKRIVLPPLQKRKEKQKLHITTGLLSGYGQRNIVINQGTADQNIQLNNFEKPSQSWMAGLQFKFHYHILEWLNVISGLQLGYQKNTLEMTNTSKSPSSFVVKNSNGLSYSAEPVLSKQDEIRTQELTYSNIELGLQPNLLKESISGPFASIVFWSILQQSSKSSLATGSMFIAPSHKTALGYRFGYQQEISKNIVGDLSYSRIPDGLSAETKGIQVSTGIISVGLNLKIR